MHALGDSTIAMYWVAVCFLQVVSLATELEEALLALCSREQLLEQIWGQLSGTMPQPAADTAAAAAAAAAAAGRIGSLQPKAAVASALSRTEQLRKLAAQQKQRWSQVGVGIGLV
jgi:hypothetical protein